MSNFHCDLILIEALKIEPLVHTPKNRGAIWCFKGRRWFGNQTVDAAIRAGYAVRHEHRIYWTGREPSKRA